MDKISRFRYAFTRFMINNVRKVFSLKGLPLFLLDWSAQFYSRRGVSANEQMERQIEDPLTGAIKLYFIAKQAMAPWVKINDTVAYGSTSSVQEFSNKVFSICILFSLSKAAAITVRTRCRVEAFADQYEHEDFHPAWKELIAAVQQDVSWANSFPDTPTKALNNINEDAGSLITGRERFTRDFFKLKAWTAFAAQIVSTPIDQKTMANKHLWRADVSKISGFLTHELAIGEFCKTYDINIEKYTTEALLNALTPSHMGRFLNGLIPAKESIFKEYFSSFKTTIEKGLPLLIAWSSGAYVLELNVTTRKLTNLRSKKTVTMSENGVKLLITLQEGPISVYDLYLKAGVRVDRDNAHKYFGDQVKRLLHRVSAMNIIKKVLIKQNDPMLYSIDPDSVLIIRE